LCDETLWKLTIYHLAAGVEMAQSIVVALRGSLKHWWITNREPIFAEEGPSLPALTFGHFLFSREAPSMGTIEDRS
jgi:hypothetical protein